jgi:predicted GIY-YIG superfamily endonuclease
MKIVYLLQSIPHLDRRYIGIADSLDDRLADHNAGRSSHTARYKPWKVMVAVQFEEDSKAFAFERYLKFGSGHAFAQRHFW